MTVSGTATYYYKVTAIDSAGGETTPSAEVSHQFTSGTTNYVTLTWNVVTGASGYRVYRSTGSGGENNYYTTLGSVSGNTVTFTDTNATYGTATPPTVSTAVLSGNINPTPSRVGYWSTYGGNGTSSPTLAVSPVNIGDVLVLTSGTTVSSTDNINSISGGGVSNWNVVVTDPASASGYRSEMWIGTVTATGSILSPSIMLPTRALVTQ